MNARTKAAAVRASGIRASRLARPALAPWPTSIRSWDASRVRAWHILTVSAQVEAGTPAAGGVGRRSRLAELASGRRLAVLLFAAGALISGFTILRRIDPFDEGVIIQAA